MPLGRATALTQRYVDVIVAHDPVAATGMGLHDRDAELPDLTRLDDVIRALAPLRREVGEALAGLRDGDPVTVAARGDLTMLGLAIDARLFWLERWPRFALDPTAVLDVASRGLHELLRVTDRAAELECQRVGDAIRRTRRIPVLLEHGGRLFERCSAPHLQVARERLPGLFALVRDELPRRAEQAGLGVVAARDAADVALEALTAFAALLGQLDELEPAPWRLGRDDHGEVLATVLGTDLAGDEVVARARAHVSAITGELVELCGRRWPELVGGRRPSDDRELVRQALHALAGRLAVGRDELVLAASAALAEARQWTTESDLVDVPPEELVRLVEVPTYLRGVANAFVQPPPPFEPESGSTYYVSPVPSHWDAERASSFLREYNRAQLRSLALHEGYPGHVVQLEHAARHPRLNRRLLSSPVFAEGWAVHVERVAVSRGFGDDLYRLTQRKLELRIATNALLDVGLHAGELSEDEALRMVVDEAFQEHEEARGKLIRARVTAGQLSSYFVGGEEVDELVTDLGGPSRGTYGRLLDHGTPTVAVLRDEVQATTDPPRRPFAPGRPDAAR